MSEAIVTRGPTEKPLRIRLNGSNPTFKLQSERIAATLVSPIAPHLEDLIEIAGTVFAADSSVVRGGATRPDMGESWHRNFDFSIPVRDPGFWSRSEVTSALTDAVTFLTDDVVTFKFVPRPEQGQQQGFLQFDPASGAFAADEVILFSGGLDSFAGALEWLSTRTGRVALVSHRSSQKVATRQQQLGQYLVRRFPGRVLHIQVAAHRVGSEAREATQRSRSFLFAALGQTVARMLGASQVSFYENGIVSHNLLISPQVVGTMATRTTHPLTLRKLNELMALIGSAPVPIHNPYQWMTKTEVVRRIADHGEARQIRHAVSCTSVREQDRLHTHCGTCSQCLDRRFAILAAGLQTEEPDEMYATDVLFGARESDRSRTMALDWTRHAARLPSLDAAGFMKVFGQEVLRIARGYPDLPQREIVERVFDLQQRHGRAVTGVLERAITDKAGPLARQSLPETALLRLHLAGGDMSDPKRVGDPRAEARAPAPRTQVDSDAPDLVFNPNHPLEVTFTHDGRIPVIDIRGLGTLQGAPARVAHELKPDFDADRAAGLSRDAHRFIAQGDLAKRVGVAKTTITQGVKRCRKALAELYHDLVGAPPALPLLIESKKARGYRLDPDIRPLAKSEATPHVPPQESPQAAPMSRQSG
ncbi:7-cyano-7-deazaguanine synthase [Tabrizicola soli]|uniref:7-cyano-7-deazaguanine synthase n=1 Tax=Tabrizicola soli TaxID=2185115 RepID=A0ABV7DUB4_9RHOB|nr:7-cyano-7-deazaguanine synthase [Tabrizicola soli]